MGPDKIGICFFISPHFPLVTPMPAAASTKEGHSPEPLTVSFRQGGHDLTLTTKVRKVVLPECPLLLELVLMCKAVSRHTALFSVEWK